MAALYDTKVIGNYIEWPGTAMDLTLDRFKQKLRDENLSPEAVEDYVASGGFWARDRAYAESVGASGVIYFSDGTPMLQFEDLSVVPLDKYKEEHLN